MCLLVSWFGREMTPIGAVLADVLEGGKGKKIKKDEDVVENR